ncbi:radical SAM/SPASM domain-containing protein [Clostridium paraputrificum]|uniref:radical SAM/SPASM domain-containing protein n=1 Tax=Clostridium paraputrificum TaxID=29363 RepID=UPI003D32DB3A
MDVPIILKENIVSQINNHNSNISLDMIDDNKYIILKENYHLHNWPDKTLLIFNGIEVMSLNLDASKIVEKLNGEYTLSEIVSNMSNKKKNLYLREYFLIKTFILQLYKRDLIDFLENKEYRKIRITGSRKWFVPYSCSIEITKRCDLRCKHCYGEAGGINNIQLTEEEIYSILDNLHDGCKNISLTGGDPMCHPKIKEIIKYCMLLGFETTLITNGMRIDNEWASWLSKAGIKRVKLSLDGSTSYMHDELRGIKGAFDKLMSSMKYLKNENVNFSIGTVITKENLEFIDEISNIAYKNGAKSIGFGRIVNQGRAKKEIQDIEGYNIKEIIEKIDKTMRAYRENDFLVTYEEDGNWINTFQDKCPSLEEYYLYKDRNIKCSCSGCGAGSRLLFIEANGNVKPCMMSCFSFGNIKGCNDIKNIINEKSNKCFSNLENPDLDTCKSCKYLSDCLGCISKSMAKGSTVECNWKDKILKDNLDMRRIFNFEVDYV